jgi:hypothetical protein
MPRPSAWMATLSATTRFFGLTSKAACAAAFLRPLRPSSTSGFQLVQSGRTGGRFASCPAATKQHPLSLREGGMSPKRGCSYNYRLQSSIP